MSQNFAVDAYVDHIELEDKLNKREEEGWILMQMIECQNNGSREFVTLMWRSGKAIKEAANASKIALVR